MAEDDSGRKTLMLTTPGVTSKRFSELPLMTEGEATPGDDRANPFRSVEEREYVEEVERREREREDDQLFKTMDAKGGDTGGVDSPMQSNSTVNEPTKGNDPFIFDNLNPGLPSFGEPQDVDILDIGAFDPNNNQGPMW